MKRISCILLLISNAAISGCVYDSVTKIPNKSTSFVNNTHKITGRDPVYNSVLLLKRDVIVDDEVERHFATGFIYKKTKDYYYALSVYHFCKKIGNKVEALNALPEKQITEYEGEVIAVTLINDLCVIKFDNVDNKLKAIKIAEERPQLGDYVMSIGAPQITFPLKSSGYIGLIERAPLDFSCICSLRITSIPADQGSSGSPVYNSKFELVGIITGMNANFKHITLAILLNDIKAFIKDVTYD